MYNLPLSRALAIEEEATMARWQHFGGGIPVSPSSILKHAQVGIYYLPKDFRYEAVFDLSQRPFRLGLRAKPDNIPGHSYSRRLQFTMGHEVGHLVLHSDSEEVHRESTVTIIEAAEENNYTLHTKEIEANCFSAALLMPKKEFQHDISYSRIHSADDWLFNLARRYNVSLGAAELRFARLRSGYFLTGYASLSNGCISTLVPSLDLESDFSDLASEAWKFNPQVCGHVNKVLPNAWYQAIHKQLLECAVSEIAEICDCPEVDLSDLFKSVPSNTVKPLHVRGCYRNWQKMLFFEIQVLEP